MKWIDTLIQLRQDSVDNTQKELAKLQGHLQQQKFLLQRLQNEYQAIELPRHSNGAILKQFTTQRDFATKAIKEQAAVVAKIEQEVERLQQQYLQTNQELEQAKYIKADHVKKELYKQKQKEQKLIDELASQRFYTITQEAKKNV